MGTGSSNLAAMALLAPALHLILALVVALFEVVVSASHSDLKMEKEGEELGGGGVV